MMAAAADSVKKTLYDLLETRADAGRDDIEQAYRAAVKRLQPEIDAGQPDALNQLRLLSDAYYILTNDERRARYDARMQPVGGTAESGSGPQPVGRRKIDGLGWAIIVVLAVVVIGGMLTLFRLLDGAEDVRTEYAEILRQKEAEERKVWQRTIIRRPASAGGAPSETKDK